MKVPLIKGKEGYTLRVLVRTGSKNPGIELIDNETVRVRVRAQPHEGMANKELIEILSDYLGIAKSRLEISAGEKNKSKIIRIRGQID